MTPIGLPAWPLAFQTRPQKVSRMDALGGQE
jgi:hypothetical protein